MPTTTLDEDIRDSRINTRAQHIGGIIKAKAASGNWVAGMLVLILISSLLVLGTVREYLYWSMHRRTCEGVLLGADTGKLEFLAKNCVGK